MRDSAMSIPILGHAMQTYYERCCERAEAAEANAEKAKDPEAKRLWLSVAGMWRKIAQHAGGALSHDVWVASGSPAANVRTPHR